MAMVNDHCTARCPKIKCKLCSKFGHVKRDCPRLKSKIKDYTKEKHEKDNDLIVYWGGHCDVCKQGVRNLLAKKPLKPLKEFPPNPLTPPQGSPSLSRAETSARAWGPSSDESKKVPKNVPKTIPSRTIYWNCRLNYLWESERSWTKRGFSWMNSKYVCQIDPSLFLLAALLPYPALVSSVSDVTLFRYHYNNVLH